MDRIFVLYNILYNQKKCSRIGKNKFNHYSRCYITSKGSNQVTIFSMLFNKKVCYIAHPNVPNAGCPWSVQAVESLRLGARHVAVTISPGHLSPAVLA